MRTIQLFSRSGLAVAAAALPLTLASPAAAAWNSGISVSTSGSNVSVTTTTCTPFNGSLGNASLLSGSQANFTQGRLAMLTGSNISQSGTWSNVSPGTYTVVVVCANGSTAGTQTIIVSGNSTPTISATASPSRGVMGGVGGSVEHYGTITFAVGAALVAVGAVATGWYLRRRTKPYRL
ncbi:hypothetical protein [Streptomyces avermitilis]|uniref:hypothetical protein n=1 Tax=Streptomyces avermitilis TaxID=33903 RepID=UPI0036A5AC21